MLGFSLSRLQHYDYDGTFKNDFALVVGQWYYFQSGRERIGMIIHLGAILPAGILVVLQFVPKIREKLLIFHRINGYLVILLGLLSSLATLAVIPHKQGGGARISTQTAEAFLVIITTVSVVLAWWNIRRKRVDQHRAWMLRTWFYMGTIITSRITEFIASPIITRIGGWYGVWTCDEIDFLYSQMGMPFPSSEYPTCVSPDGSINRDLYVAVKAVHSLEHPEQFGTSHTQPFGAMVSESRERIIGSLTDCGIALALYRSPYHWGRVLSVHDSEGDRKTAASQPPEARRSRSGMIQLLTPGCIAVESTLENFLKRLVILSGKNHTAPEDVAWCAVYRDRVF